MIVKNPSTPNNLALAFDIGLRRIGVAKADLSLRLPLPLPTITHQGDILASVCELITQYNPKVVVFGLPRNLAGDDTKQTLLVRHLGAELHKATNLPVYFQDEALTSVVATDTLRSTKKDFKRVDIDSLAAQLILEDYLQQKAKR